MLRSIDLPLERIQTYCRRQPIQRLAVFGSALRDDFTGDSDLDLLVEYQPDATITLLDMAQQELDLSAIIGRKVDLRTPNELSRYFRQQVLDAALVLYEHQG